MHDKEVHEHKGWQRLIFFLNTCVDKKSAPVKQEKQK